MESFRTTEVLSEPAMLPLPSTTGSSNLVQSALSPNLNIHPRAASAVQEHLLDQIANLGETYERTKRTKVEENVATAALYVSFLFSGEATFEEFLDGIEQ